MKLRIAFENMDVKANELETLWLVVSEHLPNRIPIKGDASFIIIFIKIHFSKFDIETKTTTS